VEHQYSGGLMNIYSGIDLLVALMEKFKIPEMNGRAMLPPEEETRTQVNRTQIFLAPGTIEVDANDLELWVNPETGFFEVNGVWGAAYRHTTYNAYVTDVEQLPKWHISMCSTLSKYLANGDLAERYALKSSTVKDNDFVLSVIRLNADQKIKRELRPCKKCMQNLNEAYGGGFRDARRYRFLDFLKEVDSGKVAPKFNTDTFKTEWKPNVYNSDFRQKATEFKRNRSNCDRCGGKFLSRFLEVHHKNRLKYDDRTENWELLCVACHVGEHKSDNPRMRLAYQANGRLDEFFQFYPQVQSKI
jgi:ribosomal protein S27AE